MSSDPSRVYVSFNELFEIFTPLSGLIMQLKTGSETLEKQITSLNLFLVFYNKRLDAQPKRYVLNYEDWDEDDELDDVDLRGCAVENFADIFRSMSALCDVAEKKPGVPADDLAQVRAKLAAIRALDSRWQRPNWGTHVLPGEKSPMTIEEALNNIVCATNDLTEDIAPEIDTDAEEIWSDFASGPMPAHFAAKIPNVRKNTVPAQAPMTARMEKKEKKKEAKKKAKKQASVAQRLMVPKTAVTEEVQEQPKPVFSGVKNAPKKSGKKGKKGDKW